MFWEFFFANFKYSRKTFKMIKRIAGHSVLSNILKYVEDFYTINWKHFLSRSYCSISVDLENVLV